MSERMEKATCGFLTELTLPRCAFYPKGMAQRCEHKAKLAIIKPENRSFWYYPVCESCLAEAAELNENHLQATLIQASGEGQPCGEPTMFVLVLPSLEGDFTYFPVSEHCLELAAEDHPNHILAHLYGYGDEEHS